MELIKEIIDIAIVVILGLMGFVALWFTIERLIFLKRVKEKFAAFKNQEEMDNALTNNLTTLYIIYSNAPYVGLLGTVIGIMITFYDMGQAASIDASQIMTGLSLALYATALGLVVAIPTLIAYNGLNRKIVVISSQFKSFMEAHAASAANTHASASATHGAASAKYAQHAAELSHGKAHDNVHGHGENASSYSPNGAGASSRVLASPVNSKSY